MDSTFYQTLARSKLFGELRRAFSDATNLSLELAPAGALPPARHPAACAKSFCALLSGNARACEACHSLQQEFQRGLERKLMPQQVCCFAGLTELAVPVLVEGRHVATLVGGRVFQNRPSKHQFRRLAERLRQWGLNGTLRLAERAYFEVPVVPKKQFQGAARLLNILANQLAECAPRLLLAKAPHDPQAVVDAKRFVLAHVAEPMTLNQAATHVHLSRNHFCRLFSHSTGMTFLEFVARARVEKAKQLLGEGHLRITDVADRAGFQSISQFNRVFRRLTGVSPTSFRAAAAHPVRAGRRSA